MNNSNNGLLAYQSGKALPLKVLQSGRGYYIGTLLNNMPYTRESNEYFNSLDDALYALSLGDWTQKLNP